MNILLILLFANTEESEDRMKILLLKPELSLTKIIEVVAELF